MMVSALWWSLFEIFFVTLQVKHFVKGTMVHRIDLKIHCEPYPHDISPFQLRIQGTSNYLPGKTKTHLKWWYNI